MIAVPQQHIYMGRVTHRVLSVSFFNVGTTNDYDVNRLINRRCFIVTEFYLQKEHICRVPTTLVPGDEERKGRSCTRR